MRWWPRRRRGPATCREVGRVLQSYLDAQIDDDGAERVAAHLEKCRKCGLEAETYREIKRALHRQTSELSEQSTEQLRVFARRLADGDPDLIDEEPAAD